MEGGWGQVPLPAQTVAPVGSGGGGSSNQGTSSQHLPEQGEEGEGEEEGVTRLLQQQQQPPPLNVVLRPRHGQGQGAVRPPPASGGSHPPAREGPQQQGQRAVGEGESSSEQGGEEPPAGEAGEGVHEAWVTGAVAGLDLAEFPPGHAPRGPSSQAPPSTMVRGSRCVHPPSAHQPCRSPIPQCPLLSSAAPFPWLAWSIPIMTRRGHVHSWALANPLLSPHPPPGQPSLTPALSQLRPPPPAMVCRCCGRQTWSRRCWGAQCFCCGRTTACGGPPASHTLPGRPQGLPAAAATAASAAGPGAGRPLSPCFMRQVGRHEAMLI